MSRIAWIEDADARGQLADLFATARVIMRSIGLPEGVPDIYRAMGHQPDFLAAVMEMERLHSTDGALTHAQHDLIASYVSVLNRSHDWLSVHTWSLQLQGEQYTEVAKMLRDGDLDRLPVSPAERLLLEFVGTLTRHAYRITDEQVQALRDVGWTDAQIAEAVYEGALYNMLVRIADAFDIHPPASWQPIMEPEGVPAAITRD